MSRVFRLDVNCPCEPVGTELCHWPRPGGSSYQEQMVVTGVGGEEPKREDEGCLGAHLVGGSSSAQPPINTAPGPELRLNCRSMQKPQKTGP